MRSQSAGPVAQQRALTRLCREQREHYRRIYADAAQDDLPSHQRRSRALLQLSRECPERYRALYDEERAKLGPNDERGEINPDVIGRSSGPGPTHAVLADGSTTSCGRIRFHTYRTTPGAAAREVTCTACVDELRERPGRDVDPQFTGYAATAEKCIAELADLRARTAAAERATFNALAALRTPPPTGTPERERLSGLLAGAVAGGLPLRDIGRRMGISGERVRQFIADPSGTGRAAERQARHAAQNDTEVSTVCPRCGTALAACQVCGRPSQCGDAWCTEHVPDGA